MPAERRNQFNLWYVIIGFWALMLFQAWWNVWNTTATIPYSEFESQLAAGNVDAVTVTDNRIEGSLKSPDLDGAARFVTMRVDPDIAERLAAEGVTYTGATENTFFADLLSWVLPVALMAGIWWFVFRRIAERQGIGGLTAIGKSRAKVYVETDTKVTFADVVRPEQLPSA